MAAHVQNDVNFWLHGCLLRQTSHRKNKRGSERGTINKPPSGAVSPQLPVAMGVHSIAASLRGRVVTAK